MLPAARHRVAQVEARHSMSAGGRCLVACLVLSLCAVCGEAYLFSLLLSNPMVDVGVGAGADGDGAGDRSKGHGRVQVHGRRRSEGVQERDAEMDVSLDVAVSVASDLGVTGSPACLTARQCGRGRYCQPQAGTCHRRLRSGEVCTRDDECRGRSSTCHMARCSRKHQRRQHRQRQTVLQCRGDADCESDSCCARLGSGDTECRRRTPVGQRCRATTIDIPVPIYATCPCERGAQCKYIHRPGEEWTLWTAYDNLRCVEDATDNVTL